MQKHSKHSKLTKRKNGIYAPNEIAILGVKCAVINDLVNNITKSLNAKYQIAYLDASHDKNAAIPILNSFTFQHNGGLLQKSNNGINKYNEKIRLSNYDLTFINGNHFQGNQQILILDPEKEASVLKRIDQIDNLQFLINLNNDSKIFDFLLEKYPSIKNLTIYNIEDIEGITNHIERIILQEIPALNALVLAGGKSVRMGKDKGLLEFHGMAQRDYAFKVFSELNFQTFLSVRKEQNISNIDTIEDVFEGLGPFGAICSAFQKDPNKAWFVLATDVPFISKEIIEKLLSQRNPSKIATTFKGKSKQFPEPLITIYEPKAYPVLLSYLAQGYSCPRKVLINSDVEIIEIDDHFITNINTPEDFDKAKKHLSL